MKKGTRINKYLSEIGYCSRREADKLIDARRVRVNGKVPVSATLVNAKDKIVIDGVMLEIPEDHLIFLAFNKPVGIVSTTDTKGEKDNIIDYINYPRRIFPIGRLDKPSEGLIFLTSDGDIVNKILRAGNHHEKEYLVTVNKPITDDFIEKMSSGVPIMGQTTRKCKVVAKGKMNFSIILTQGLNRQIRRMCEYFGYEVKKLKRVRIMNIPLDVPVGQWRDLNEEEINEIRKLVASSSKTQKTTSASKNTPPKKHKPANRSKKSSSTWNTKSSSRRKDKVSTKGKSKKASGRGRNR